MIEQISTESGVTPAAPISQAIRAGGFIFVSGQTGRNPATREIVSDDVGEQTRQIFENVANVLAAGGSSLDNVVRNTVYLTDLDEKPAFNEAYREMFDPPFPARSVIGIDALAPDAKIEIEVTAVVD